MLSAEERRLAMKKTRSPMSSKSNQVDRTIILYHLEAYLHVLFPKCPILTYLLFQSLVNVNLDLMVYGKRVMTNVNGALQ